MKTIAVTLLLVCFALTGHSQDTIKSVNPDKQKPKATYQVGSAKVVVWENKGKDGTTWKNFKVEKVYQKDDKWLSTNSFDDKELLDLQAAIDKAITEEKIKVKTSKEKK